LQAAQAHTQTKACKRVCFPRPWRKNKKSSPLNKNKTLPKRNPAGESRMTELIDNNKGKSLEKKEGQLVTANKLKQGLRASLDRKVLNLKFSSSWQVQWLNSLPAPICRTLPTSLKETVPMKICCIEIEKENATAQKQECGCPSLQPSLRNHTHAFFASAPASLIIMC